MKKFKAWAVVDERFRGIKGLGIVKMLMHHRKRSASLWVENNLKLIHIEIREVKRKAKVIKRAVD